MDIVYIGWGEMNMAEIVAFPHESHHRPTVLVVDDEPTIRAFLCDYLNQAGLHAITATSGDEATYTLKADNAIDLVFSDVHMPGSLDGYALARWIMDNRPGLPVLLASGDLGQLKPLQELSGAEIVPKPYDFDMVVRKIRAALSTGKRRSA